MSIIQEIQDTVDELIVSVEEELGRELDPQELDEIVSEALEGLDDEEPPVEQRCGGVGGTPGPCAAAEDKAKTLGDKLKSLPGKIAGAAVAKVQEKYQQLEGRYGRTMAIAILGAGIAGLPIPLPGSSLIMAAPLLAAAELYRRASQRCDEILSDEQLTEIGVEFLQEILDEWQQDNKESEDDPKF
jgi:hypothetical protein